MKYIFLAVTLLITTTVFAMPAANEPARVHEENVQKQIQRAPEMSTYCKKRLEYLKGKIKKYQDKLAKEDKSWYKAKLDYYQKEFENWTGYCTKPEGE